MNIFRKITWITMKQNRTRTIVTIIGIILSTSLFTAVASFSASLFHFMEQEYIYLYGNYHISASLLPSETLHTLSLDERTKQSVAAAYMGYGQLTEETISRKPYLYVSGGNESFFQNMPIHLTSGRLPENDQEIILPVSMLTQNSLQLSLGNQLTLELGDRILNGSPLGQMQELTEGETWTAYEDGLCTYTIVGFYAPELELNYLSPGYSVFTYCNTPDAASLYDSFILLKNPGQDMEAFATDYQLINFSISKNTRVLMLSGVSDYDNIFKVILYMIFLLFLLIFVASVSLIYNAFAISVSERTKQFGLLSSIGATKRQIRKSVFTEAVTLSAIGIPIGICIGIAGIGITMFFCRDLFDTIFNSHFHLTLHTNGLSVFLSALTALITVLVSAWIPSKRAMKVTAIEAIRQSKDIKSSRKPVRYSSLFARIFRLEGILAKKYYKNNKKKYRATIFSLAVSIILFVSASAFCLYLSAAASTTIDTANYDVSYTSSASCTDILKLREAFASAAGVTDLSIYAELPYLYCHADDFSNTITDEYKEYYNKEEYYTSIAYNGCLVTLRYIDDESFLHLLDQYKQNPTDYFSAENRKILFINTKIFSEYITDEEGNLNLIYHSIDFLKQDSSELVTILSPPDTEDLFYTGTYWTGAVRGEGEQCYYYVSQDYFNSLNADLPLDETGHPLDATIVPVNYETLQIGYLLKEPSLGFSLTNEYSILYPMSLFPETASCNATVYFKTDSPQETLADVKQILKDNGIPYEDYQLVDAEYYDRQNRNLVTLVHVFSYGFIILISLISIANVFNTISTNVALRRRDYAMLRSVGLTRKGMDRMMCYECLLYGSRALFTGLPVSAIFSYAVYQVLKGSTSVDFFLPWNAIVFAVCSVFLVVFITMLYAINKLKSDNTIDAMKNENL